MWITYHDRVLNLNLNLVIDTLDGKLLEAYSSPVGSSKGWFQGFNCKSTYNICSFGVPEILSSDEGTEFMATATEDLLAGASNTDNPQSTSHNQMGELMWL